MRGIDAILFVPYLLLQHSFRDVWRGLVVGVGFVGLVFYLIARGTNRHPLLARLSLAAAIGGFSAMTLSFDSPFWRFWSWGFWLLWAGLVSSVLLEVADLSTSDVASA